VNFFADDHTQLFQHGPLPVWDGLSYTASSHLRLMNPHILALEVIDCEMVAPKCLILSSEIRGQCRHVSGQDCLWSTDLLWSTDFADIPENLDHLLEHARGVSLCER